MKALLPLFLVIALVALIWLGVEHLHWHQFFGVVVPYAALVVFVVGFVFRVVRWGRSPVPFRIPTTCGQEKSLPWIKANRLENPSGKLGVLGRMLLEVLCFRSLFRNTRTEKHGAQLGFGSAKWLWLGGLVFHWSLLIILLRHLRFFLDPVPWAVQGLEAADSFIQVGIPLLYVTDAAIVAALTYLFLRRVVAPRIRYISLPADYLALFLLLAVALSGILMRYWFKVDLLAVKEMTMGLATFSPQASAEVGASFYVHLGLVSVLFAYFPFSKLMHAGGVFFSPTRNLANNSRQKRHVNPWNYPVAVHTYAEYEAEFAEKMRKAGLPTDQAAQPEEQGD
ncbi:MAG: sulfate reduction electron transfer complex DsrMKJOP subunit DsrM [Coriobacteriales bacterium]|jgi:nitrate reductase gamma subunit|nr:sulfate reduction electron transfer complex DsrMKJOP subunit DsrM [Coriobacteriales bacterium]